MFFFFNDTATTEIYTLSLHDALPISVVGGYDGVEAFVTHDHLVLAVLVDVRDLRRRRPRASGEPSGGVYHDQRSEEHTSELQSRQYLVCRLLLEKKKRTT